MKQLDKILNKDEEVLWEGKPKFLPFITPMAIVFIIFGTLVLSFSVLFTLMYQTTFMGPFILLGIILLVGGLVYLILEYKYTYYAITDKRIMIQGGVIGRDFQIFDYDQITNAEVNMGIFDKLLGGNNTGTILIATADMPLYRRSRRYGTISTSYMMKNIPSPYQVFKFFKKVSFDVKTDMEFPNKYRSKRNPGYQTDYDLDKSDKK